MKLMGLRPSKEPSFTMSGYEQPCQLGTLASSMVASLAVESP